MIGSATYGTEEAEKQKDPAKADYSSNSFTIPTMPSLIRGTLKFKQTRSKGFVYLYSRCDDSTA